MTTVMQILSPLDVLALVVLVSAWLGYELFGERAAERGDNLSGLMQGWRTEWTAAAVHRDNRIIDIQILRSLAGNSAFLASTSIFVIGGLAAMIGGSEHAVAVLNGFDYLLETTRDRFGVMVGALIVVFINAFFRRCGCTTTPPSSSGRSRSRARPTIRRSPRSGRVWWPGSPPWPPGTTTAACTPTISVWPPPPGSCTRSR